MKPVFLFLLISYISISEAQPFSKNQTRSLAEVSNLYFIKAKDLIFDSNNIWRFTIIYYTLDGSELVEGQNYYVSILYAGNPSLAKCEADLYPIMNCFIEKPNQKKTDLVRLNNEFVTNANIRWENLTNIYDIVINCSLTFKNAFNLTHYKYKTNYPNMTYLVEIEKDSLPENALVTMDVFYYSKNNVSTCSHSKSLLFCYFVALSGGNWISKIVPKRHLGSIEWENLEETSEIYIPVVVSITEYSVTEYIWPENLELIDNKWHFTMKATYDNGIQKLNEKMKGFFTANVRIDKQNGESDIYLTKCLGLDDEDVKCIVEGENQNVLDVVYLTDTIYYNATARVLYLEEDLIIYRNVSLSFVKAFDYFNRSSGFKIQVEDDEDVPNGAAFFVDIAKRNPVDYIEQPEYFICRYNDHIAKCGLRNSVSAFKLSMIREKGSITWINLKERYIDIPKNHTWEFKIAYGSFFTDKWYFFVNFTDPMIKNKYNLDIFNIFIIDIIHNKHETTAKCETIKYDADFEGM